MKNLALPKGEGSWVGNKVTTLKFYNFSHYALNVLLIL